MKLDLRIDGREVAVVLERQGDGLRGSVGEHQITARDEWLADRSVLISIAGRNHDVEIVPLGRDRIEVHVGSTSFQVDYPGLELLASTARGGRGGSANVVAPMPGKVVALLVEEGDEVEEGSGVVIVEAMKMENEIQAPAAGRVARIRVAPGDVVEGGATLVEIG